MDRIDDWLSEIELDRFSSKIPEEIWLKRAEPTNQIMPSDKRTLFPVTRHTSELRHGRFREIIVLSFQELLPYNQRREQ